jgi:hypothetical protein
MYVLHKMSFLLLVSQVSLRLEKQISFAKINIFSKNNHYFADFFKKFSFCV